MKIVCPKCGKFLFIVNETKSNDFKNTKKIKIWCKVCKKEIEIEIEI